MSLLGSLFGSSGGSGDGQQPQGAMGPELIALLAQHAGDLPDIVQKFESAGLGGVVSSWVGQGGNQPIAPEQVQQALGPDQVSAMATKSGMSTQDMLSMLAQQLPQLVDHMTPNGQLPASGSSGGSLLQAGLDFLRSRST